MKQAHSLVTGWVAAMGWVAAITYLVRDGAVPLARAIFFHVEPNQLADFHRDAVHRVLLIFPHVRHNIENVKHHPICSAHWCLEGLQAQRAAVERQRAVQQSGPLLCPSILHFPFCRSDKPRKWDEVCAHARENVHLHPVLGMLIPAHD